MNNGDRAGNTGAPRNAPGKPPKSFDAKKAIGVFALFRFSYGAGCPELLRARIGAKGDIYIVPEAEHASSFMGNIKGFHMSHHRSGRFHWAFGDKHISPARGESDYPAALGLVLKFKSPPCYCLRRGKDLDAAEIAALVQRLASYLPFGFDIPKACKNLTDTNFSRFRSVPTPGLHEQT